MKKKLHRDESELASVNGTAILVDIETDILQQLPTSASMSSLPLWLGILGSTSGEIR
jgi:hypothetical protein